MLQFCKQHNLNPSAMSSLSRGRRGTFKGYKCKKLTNNRNVPHVYEEYRYLTKEEKSKINSDSVKNAKRKSATPFIEYDGVTYNSIAEASEATEKSYYLITKYGKRI